MQDERGSQLSIWMKFYDRTKFTWGIDIMETDPEKAVVWAHGAQENNI